MPPSARPVVSGGFKLGTASWDIFVFCSVGGAQRNPPVQAGGLRCAPPTLQITAHRNHRPIFVLKNAGFPVWAGISISVFRPISPNETLFEALISCWPR